MHHFDSPASMSIHEEVTLSRPGPGDGGLQQSRHVRSACAAETALKSIVPDLATELVVERGQDRADLRLHQGVKWHDGKPFTANDVKCTWDLLLGKAQDKLRLNPRKAWYQNLDEVTTNGDYEVTFHLKRPQPAFIALLASGWSPVYPCHVPPREMRSSRSAPARSNSSSTSRTSRSS